MASPSSAVSSRWFRTRRGPLVYCASSLLAIVLAFAAGPSGCSLNAAGIGGGSGAGGQPAGCMQDEDCNDNNPCTDDTCTAHMCNHVGNSYVPDDHNECTVDSCKGGVATHDAMAATGKTCGVKGTLTCDGMGNCGGCMADADCQPSTDCQKWGCNLGTKVCESTNLPVGTMATDAMPGDCMGTFCDGNGGTKDAALPVDTACSVNNGKFCDMMAKCVECVADKDCTTGLSPSCDLVAQKCTSCDDKVMNGNELGVDCGGPKCGKCKGDSCGGGIDCANGLPCVDGVCCENMCNNACQACNVQGQLGNCVNISAGMPDPPGCNAPTSVCDANGACKTSMGQPCMNDGDCYSKACGAGLCRGAVGDACMDKADCASNRCVANKCAACSIDQDCLGSTCNKMAQRCTGAYGDPCAADGECTNGKCRYGLCRNDVNDTCTADNQCVTEFCKIGKCAPCTLNSDCMLVNPGNAQCTGALALNTCQIPKDAYCNPSLPAQCSSQMCKGFPAKCQ